MDAFAHACHNLSYINHVSDRGHRQGLWDSLGCSLISLTHVYGAISWTYGDHDQINHLLNKMLAIKEGLPASTLCSHHDDVIKWKHFPRYWPFVRGIHRSPVNSPYRKNPVTQSFEIFFGLHVNKRLSKQSWGWWFEMLSRPLWHHCTDNKRWRPYPDKCVHWNENVIFWWNVRHWVHQKLSSWQFPGQPVMETSSKWKYFRNSVIKISVSLNYQQ